MSLIKGICLQIMFFCFIYIIIYIQLRNRLLRKFHPNRWSIFTTGIIVMILPKSIEYMFKYSINNTFFKYIHAAVFIVLFIWFLELKGGYIYKIGSNRKKDIKIKAKAKPNRLKNMKQQKSHNV